MCIDGKINVLFVGTYLSRTTGSRDVAETIKEELAEVGINIKLVSTKKNKIFRLLDVLLAVYTTKSSKIHFDVYSGNSFFLTFVAILTARIRRRYTISTIHGGRFHDFYQRFPKLISIFFRLSHVTLTPSKFLKEYFETKSITIKYNPNPLDLSSFPYKFLEEKNYKILWVRAFSDIYNPELAINTLAEVLNLLPQASITMVGPDKGYRQQVEVLARELNLEDKVEFTGPIPNNLLSKVYQKHTVYINTTRYESFGVSVMEAASCGIPIVSTNVGEIPYLWKDGENILLVDNFSPQQMAQQIVRIMGDETLRAKLSKSARANAEQFSWQKIEPGWVELLSKS